MTRRGVYPLPWFSFPVGAVSWTMFITSERATPQVRGLEGVTLHDQCACFVNVRHAKVERAAQAIAFHEMMHAGAWGSGASVTLWSNVDEQEERAIQTLAPVLFDMLVRAGLLTFPAMPTRRPR